MLYQQKIIAILSKNSGDGKQIAEFKTNTIKLNVSVII